MAVDWQDLGRRLARAAGSDAGLEAVLAEAFGQPAAGCSGSVEAARALAAAVLPQWRLHLGFGASGVFPYASLAADDTRVVCDAPTVPLAILRAMVAVSGLPPRPAASPAPSVPTAP